MEWWVIALIIVGGLIVLPLAVQGLVMLLALVFSLIVGLASAVYFSARKMFGSK